MDRKAEFIKANKQLLGKGLDYIALDRKYIEWLEHKLEKAEAENASSNTAYMQCLCEDCKNKECEGWEGKVIPEDFIVRKCKGNCIYSQNVIGNILGDIK